MAEEMDDLDGLLDPHVNKDNPDGNFQQESIPNANAVLVLGICSIVGCVLAGIGGLVCGIIALIMFKKVKATHDSNPIKYQNSFKNAKAGQICAIIGTILSGIYFLFWLIYIVIIGTVIANMPVV